MSAKAIRAFIRQLGSDDEATRLDAADALARYGPLAFEAVEALAGLMDDRGAGVRAAPPTPSAAWGRPRTLRRRPCWRS